MSESSLPDQRVEAAAKVLFAVMHDAVLADIPSTWDELTETGRNTWRDRAESALVAADRETGTPRDAVLSEELALNPYCPPDCR